jgi:D-glycero-alpha-D-manno-heptose-7-phosphate kinase
LLHALHAFHGDRVTPSLLATEAIHIEREVLGECVGIQDQLMAAHGGFCFIEFSGNAQPRVSHVRITLENLLSLQHHMLLIFTNIKRRAQEIERTKIAAIRDRVPALRRIHQCCNEALKIFEGSGSLNIAEIGRLLDESWQEKKRLSGSVSNATIDDMYACGIRHGAYGGKILGAGGGGFLLLLAPPERHPELREAFRNFHIQSLEIGCAGSEVIFNATGARSPLL